jgi:signal transduction histidine kinase
MGALSSLTNRIFLACALLASLSLGFAFYFVNGRVSSEAEAELRRGLQEAGTLVDQQRTSLTDMFTLFARLVADLPKLKAAVGTGDPPTVQPIAEDYGAQMKADLVIVRGRDGTRLASAGVDVASLPPLIAAADSPAEVSAFWPHSRGVLQVVSVPILIGLAPTEVMGRLTVGFFLDDLRANAFKDATGSEIAFGAAGRVLASTLPHADHDTLAAALQSEGISTVTIGDEEFIALRRRLGDATSPAYALILRSRTDRLRFLSTIRTGLAGALIVSVLLATLLSYAVARTMTRPIAAITNAMRDVAATGDLTRKVSLRSRGWDDEDARLLAATFNTLTDSIAKFQKEAAQRERLSSLGRLSTVVAHEIRNPLMIIRASLRSLRPDQVTPAELREAVADIDEETDRLNRIVTDVLDFAKPMRFDLAETSINALCRASAAAADAREGPPVIALDLDPSDPTVVTDAERLRTALVNILTNARHAVESTPQVAAAGGVALASESAIRIVTRVEQGRLSITVSDRGVGIAADDLAHVFDPYFTTRRAGTGLGLPIARNIVEGLGGSISVSSRTGHGTDIRIELPFKPATMPTSIQGRGTSHGDSRIDSAS